VNTLVVYVLLSTSGMSCNNVSVGDRGLELHVATFNVQDVNETFEETRVRMRTMARGLEDALPFWSLIGIQESRYKKDWTGLPGLSTSYQLDEEFDCGGVVTTGAGCFGSYLGTDLVGTYRGNGVVAQEYWDLRTEIRVDLEGPSDVQAGGGVRTMYGRRLFHRTMGQVFPFFSVHMVPESAPLERQLNQARNLVNAVREAWRDGDMPPIVVGDFNCGSWDRQIREVIYSEFFEASGLNSIDLVFIGRPQRYRNAAGTILPAATDEVSGSYDPGPQSDHSATWVKLLADDSADMTTASVPPEQDLGGRRGCRPVVGED